MKIWNFKTPLTLVASIVWNASEYFNMPLNKFSPVVFHLMIGAKKYKKVNKTDTNL